ncbi:cobyrinic acid a,c-diamide synthase [Amycolatopsis aidingensis]|uniref:cobyrinic acid a,c-diamide synthase n=1 Tax=Amycolatopsis aidingensis TaxID=2842453 RepID=UPI001C0D571D|nr:cobyrinic acid a,c-diamide synthase [Amycolatopsis aidingensis]
MSRRASLPGASELFRRTSSPALDQPAPPASSSTVDSEGNDVHGNGSSGSNGNGNGGGGERRLSRGSSVRRGSGRQKHDAKITVYVSGEELLAMEQARLNLRAAHDLAVDRGRIVREAVAVLLADFDEHGDDSVLVRRLRGGGIEAEAEEAEEATG